MTSSSASLDLQSIVDDLFLVLTQKEKEVIVKRFSLDNKARWTLEKIGQKFSVTRERIRQIEKIALHKLRRTSQNTKLKVVADLAQRALNAAGGILTEEALIAGILKELGADQPVDGHIVKLALSIHPDLHYVGKSDQINPYFHLKNISSRNVEAVVKKAISSLQKKTDIVPESKLLSDLALHFDETEGPFTANFIRSALLTDKRLKKLDGGFGLMTWRHVNPRSIRDKAYIILRKTKAPMHFHEIADAIRSAEFDKKSVTIQAVHNELIRYDQFVLVGRGLYGLKEWGYKRGTVSDIIEDLLAKKSPLTKKEIMTGVLKQRYVKKGTISLNLQKNAHFARVGRATYALDLSKKVA